MKLIYYILIPILSVFILWFSYLLWFIKPVVIDKKIIESSTKLLQKQELTPSDLDYNSHGSIVLSPAVWDKNLFDPSRGTAAKSVVAGPGEINVEVLGIYSYNKEMGAIIIPKQGFPGSQPGGAYGGSYGSPAGFNQPGQQGKPDKKVFFKVGETLENGYTLTGIGRDYVELTGGGNKVKIPLKYDSEESIKRIAAAAKTDVKKQITIIQGIGSQSQTGNQQTQQQSGSSGGGVTVISSQQQQGGNQQQSQAVYGQGR